MVLRVGALCTR